MSTELSSPDNVSPAPLSAYKAELQRRLDAARINQAQERREKLLDRRIILLAGVPTWTESLAQRVSDHSARAPVPVPEKFAQLVADGLVEELRSPLRKEQTPERIRFVMPDTMRAEVLALNIADPTMGRAVWPFLQSVALTLCDLSPLPGDPGETFHWARLMASAADTRQLADRIDGEVRNARISTDIYSIVKVARYFEPLFREFQDPALDLTLLRAGRRLELLRRTDDDRSHLRYFLTRTEQVSALDALVGPDDEHWAMHLVGAGGVGKTMLLRHLCSTYASGRFAVAKVDFDYLNPDFPRLAPGLLLWAFGEDLRAYATDTRFDELTDEADAVLRKLHESLRANVTGSGTAITANPDFQFALKSYIEALRTLSYRVILVLDTCEELARIRSDGSVPDNVRDTFQILEALHDGLPGLRVILSGRRPLASAGFGWHCPSAAELPARNMLRLHEIRGFTLAEANRYLDGVGVPTDLHSVITLRCPDVGRVIDAQWDDPSLAPSTEVRCNPYDLKLYAEWACEDPRPDAKTIALSTAAQYVEFRILRGLRHPYELERLLPVIALLGHIDDDALRSLTNIDDTSFERLQLTLRQQEWTHVRLIADPEEGEPRHVYSVDPGLRARLQSYASEHQAQWRQPARRASRYLLRNTLDKDLSKLDWTDFEATLNALDATGTPEHLARWWQLVDGRLAERDPQWRVDLLKFLCVAEIAATDTPPVPEAKPLSPRERARPAILATYATALVQIGRISQDTFDIWSQVLSTADRYPLRRAAVRLGLQAAATRLRTSPTRPPLALLDEFSGVLRHIAATDVDPATAFYLVNTAGTLLDLFEMTELAGESTHYEFDAVMANLIDSIDALVEQLLQPLQRQPPRKAEAYLGEAAIWLRCLRARANARIGATEAAITDFATALSRARAGRDTPALLEDARQPDSLHIRVLLEYARIASPLLTTPEAVLAEISSVFPDTFWLTHEPNPTLNAERLTAIRVRLLASAGIPDAETIRQLPTGLAPTPRSGGTASQRSIPPLSCVAAEELAALGTSMNVLASLRSELHDTARYDEETRREIERAYLRIVLQLRLFERGEGTVESLLSSLRPADRALVCVVQALGGATMTGPSVSAEQKFLHAQWRGLRVRDAKSLEPELRKWQSALANTTDPDLQLDLIECNRLLGLGSQAPPGAPFTLSFSVGVATSDTERPEIGGAGSDSTDNSAAELTRALRRFALSTTPEEFEPLLQRMRARLGTRRAGELALEEATALSLRLPDCTIRLARQAHAWFSQCDDRLGAVRATLVRALAIGPARLPAHLELMSSLQDDWKQLDAQRDRVQPFSTLELAPFAELTLDEALARLPTGITLDMPTWEQLIRRFLLVRVAVTEPARLAEIQPRLFPTSPWDFLPQLGPADSPDRPSDEPPESLPTPPKSNPVYEFLRKYVRSLSVQGTLGAFILTGSATLTWRESSQHLANTVWSFLSNADSRSTALEWVFGSLALLSVWLWRQPFVPRWARHAFRGYCIFNLVGGALIFGTVAIIGSQGKDDGTGSTEILMGIALAYSAYGLWRLTRHLRLRSALREPLRITLATTAESASGRKTIAMDSAPARLSFPPLKPILLPWALRQFKNQPFDYHAENASVDRPYQDFALALQPQPFLGPIFTRLRRFLGLHYVRLDFTSEIPEDHAWPAEAAAFLNVGVEARKIRSVPFRIRRTVRRIARPELTSTPGGVASPLDLRGSPVSLLPNAALDGALQPTWNRRLGLPQQRVSLAATKESAPPSPNQEVRILHLIGTPHEDTGGLRYRLAEGPRSSTKSEFSTATLSAEEVTGSYPATQLCILQRSALVSPTARREIDRRRGALAKVFAARLVAQGVPLVITLPALEKSAIIEVTDLIARYAAHKGPHDGEAFLQLLDDLRHFIASTYPVILELDAADILNPRAVALRLANPDSVVAPLADLFTPTGRSDLNRWSDIPTEALTGLLLNELNPILRRVDLASLPTAPRDIRHRIARLMQSAWHSIRGTSREQTNRTLLPALFDGNIADGRDRTNADAWENALDVCGFCASPDPGRN